MALPVGIAALLIRLFSLLRVGKLVSLLRAKGLITFLKSLPVLISTTWRNMSGISKLVSMQLIFTIFPLLIDFLTKGALSGAVVRLALAPVVGSINLLLPDFDFPAIVSGIPSQVWEISSYLGVTPAFNMYMSGAILIITTNVSVTLTMHYQFRLARKGVQSLFDTRRTII